MEIARGVEIMHKLNVVHGNLKIVCSFLHSYSSHTLTLTQINILVDARGHARVAGLGSAFLLSAGPEVDIDRFFHGAAPELVDPQRFGSTDTGATKASDIYAFGVLAWEASLTLECLMNELLNIVGPVLRFLPGKFHSLMRVGSQGFTRC